MLGATEAGLGGCIIASIKREELCEELKIPDKYEILFILALGKPVENVIIDEIKDNDVKYWRDKKGNHHVPKRNLKELILNCKLKLAMKQFCSRFLQFYLYSFRFQPGKGE